MSVIDSSSHLLGKIIDGKWRLCRYIGRGAFGAVFEAEELVGGEVINRVALKLVYVEDQESQKDLMREMRALANLSHQGILGYRTAGIIQDGSLIGHFYIATELAANSLADNMKGAGTVDPDTVREAAVHVAEAMAYLHSNQVIHRDIKPANILQVRSHWKLADFGLARAVDRSLVMGYAQKGTVAYMAPEEIKNGHIGSATDIYAFGVTLLQSLTGHLAHSGNTIGEFLNNVLTTPPNIPPTIPEPWQTIIRCCLKCDPRSRFGAEDIVSALMASESNVCRTSQHSPSRHRAAFRPMAAFVADVSVPDGQVIPFGASFTKTWRMRNTGGSCWQQCRLSFDGGEQMNAPGQVPVSDVGPGQEVDIPVTMCTPYVGGVHRGYWRMEDSSGKFGDRVWVEINAVPPFYNAGFLADVSIPDGSVIRPGTHFTKVWKIKNTGNVRWTDCRFTFDGGELMGALSEINVPYVEPGCSVDIAVVMQAPYTYGRHYGYWRLIGPVGPFGVRVWIDISVA